MLAVTRKNKINDIIQDKKSVTVLELADMFDVTEETIRRDLRLLEKEGLCMRTYGGAFIQDGVENNIDLNVRKVAYVDSKSSIALECKKIIHNGDTIFLDPSTTALFIARVIKDMRLTVLTNSILIISELCDIPNIHLIAVGGNYSIENKAFYGLTTAQFLNQYYLDKSFISCRTLSMEHGITDSVESLCQIRQIAVHRSQKTYIVADHSKFNGTSFIKICSFDVVDGIISDFIPNKAWNDFFKNNNVEYLYAPTNK